MITADRISTLVEPVVTGRGFDLEDVRIHRRNGRDEVTVVIDRDGGNDLDDLADVTRDISSALDVVDDLTDDEYTLEVTSPGVDRPLTLPRHWRRAQGRKVIVDVTDDAGAKQLTGRVGALDDGHVTIVAANKGRLRREVIALDAVTKAVVQVDFSRPGAAELEMCGLDADDIARRRDMSGREIAD